MLSKVLVLRICVLAPTLHLAGLGPSGPRSQPACYRATVRLELKIWASIMTFCEEQYEMISCKKKKTKAHIKWCRPTLELGLMTVWSRDSHIFLTVQKLSTHIYHVKGVNQRKEPSHVIVEILLNDMGTLCIIFVFQMIYLQSLWYA